MTLLIGLTWAIVAFCLSRRSLTATRPASPILSARRTRTPLLKSDDSAPGSQSYPKRQIEAGNGMKEILPQDSTESQSEAAIRVQEIPSKSEQSNSEDHGSGSDDDSHSHSIYAEDHHRQDGSDDGAGVFPKSKIRQRPNVKRRKRVFCKKEKEEEEDDDDGEEAEWNDDETTKGESSSAPGQQKRVDTQHHHPQHQQQSTQQSMKDPIRALKVD